MIETILQIIWLVGWVASYYYVLRVICSMDGGRMDGENYLLGGIFTLFLGSVWPAVLVGRLAYIGFVRYVPPMPGLKIKPIDKPTTYRQRQAAKLDKREEELAQREAWVRERELT